MGPLKAKVKQHAIVTGKREAALTRAKVKQLTETLRGLTEADEERPGEFRDDIRFVKKELWEELEHRYCGALVRSREQTVEYEAQPSKRFRAFERERAARKTIAEVEHAGGLAHGREQVASAFHDYYSRLFRSQSTQDPVPAEVLRRIPKVSDEIRDVINSPISVEDVERTINKLS